MCQNHFAIENNHIIKVQIQYLKGNFKKKFKIWGRQVVEKYTKF